MKTLIGGRIIARLGSLNKVRYNCNDIILKINGIKVFMKGVPTNESKSNKLKSAMKSTNITIEICLNSGKHTASMFTSDLTSKYVQINSKYTT